LEELVSGLLRPKLFPFGKLSKAKPAAQDFCPNYVQKFSFSGTGYKKLYKKQKKTFIFFLSSMFFDKRITIHTIVCHEASC
jgi:hypothetical protein